MKHFSALDVLDNGCPKISYIALIAILFVSYTGHLVTGQIVLQVADDDQCLPNEYLTAQSCFDTEAVMYGAQSGKERNDYSFFASTRATELKLDHELSVIDVCVNVARGEIFGVRVKY